jgi:phosphate acetyltransferase
VDFLTQLKVRAKQEKKKIVLPESLEPRNLEAACRVIMEGVADIILLGDRAKIQEAAGCHCLDDAEIIDIENFAGMDDFVKEMVELRKSKGMTPEDARTALKNPMTFGAMLVRKGLADGMVSGAIHSSADVLRAGLQIVKTAPGTKLVSSFFAMVVPNCCFGEEGIFIFSDCGLVPNPTAEELSEIALSSAATFKMLTGKEPRVAMLSFSTMGSASHPDVDKVATATRLAQEKNPQLMIDGEMQLDAAIISSVAAQKAPNSKVAGQANVLIFPNLDAGNIGYKLVQRFAGAHAFGPVTQGISRPVNDLSRGCNADDIIGVIAITAVQAQHIK